MVFKGYGFITDSEGKEHFAHHSSIIMDDIVNFELGTGKNGREQAISVQPVLTMKMVRDSLKEGNLFVKEVKADTNIVSMNTLGMTKGYMVVNENNVIKAGEQGMSFLELAAFTGYNTEGLSD